ncbi:TSUP family transporter [Thermanaerosceptrum fracticalcis]|uniref:Probable membrane transporter protein n=1 Tax=Thermanaerosceptrum fracticalcis TaxID=1712410 RepID=A0A7G6DYQ3_THEFR|nr:sulfite exporter TauE/SafE family protein [Thermanaerosceptrum fracticalcis]QNB44957.1 TSUP family transporter [Thermanaerosceptrum fracticalcis]
MTIGTVLLILVVGVIAGFLNTVAGGGSLLTMPMFIFLGMPSALANGTNRVALTVQGIAAAINFRRKGYFDLKLGLTLGIPAMIGSYLGAKLAIDLPDAIFNKILAGVMIIVLFLIVRQPEQPVEKPEEELSLPRRILSAIVFFFVGMYGGFIQAGVGFIIIASLSLLTGMSLIKINSLKNFVVLFYMFISLVVFILEGKVDWVLGLTLSVGNGIGGWIGSSFVVAKGDKWIRLFLIVVAIIMAAKLLGVFEYLKQLF